MSTMALFTFSSAAVRVLSTIQTSPRGVVNPTLRQRSSALPKVTQRLGKVLGDPPRLPASLPYLLCCMARGITIALNTKCQQSPLTARSTVLGTSPSVAHLS